MQFASDLHLELPGNEGFALEPHAPNLALLGDICTLDDRNRSAYLAFLRRCSSLWSRVFLVPGNHEYYFGDLLGGAVSSLKALAAEAGPSVVVLERDAFDVPGTRYRVLGTTLWSRVPEKHFTVVSWSLNDYRCIVVGGPGKRAKVADTNRAHDECVGWLKGELQRANEEGVRAVVLTHHAPMLEAKSPHKTGEALNTAFVSDQTALMESCPALTAWLYGHTHFSKKLSFSRGKDEIPVWSNCLGYRGKDPDTGFSQSLVLSLP